jgi:hypothetical protein
MVIIIIMWEGIVLMVFIWVLEVEGKGYLVNDIYYIIFYIILHNIE